MKQEDKELLLKDLCARLPYKCKYKASKNITHWHKLTLSTRTIDKIIDDYYDDIKPYLRPMSSMTEEENKKLDEIWLKHTINEGADYLNSIHVDYRGLIKKGLAIEVTKENNPYKD